ncbi:MAG: PDGLE domain-containing protein [Candidatus Bathyarchaeota archaeon]|nr:PDGLE domain-containing protein [Candidatus Bathyarchaeota archaeon]MDH5787893.1 PDGLE domain-containing protein [Candidatus Bathyarchaeota archaeon]
MRRYFKALVLILVCLAVLIPFASNAPDGLEKVAEALKIEDNEPIWKGLMPDYTLPTIDDPYLSTLLAGIFGTLLVLFVAFILGTALTKLNKK